MTSESQCLHKDELEHVIMSVINVTKGVYLTQGDCTWAADSEEKSVNT